MYVCIECPFGGAPPPPLHYALCVDQFSAMIFSWLCGHGFSTISFFMQILVTHMFRLIPRIQQTIPEYTMPTNYDIKCPWTLTILVEPPRISSENATSYNFWFECKKECCPIFFLWIFRTQIVKITSNYYLGPCSRNLSKSNFQNTCAKISTFGRSLSIFFSCGFLEPRL